MRHPKPKAVSGFPPHHQVMLPNGLAVVAVVLPHLSAGWAGVMVRTGPRHEMRPTHGLSHLCEHMLFRGAGPYATSQAVAAAAERFMGSLEAHTSRDQAVFGTAFRPQDGVRAPLELLGHMMARPHMVKLAVEKRVLLEEIMECFDERGQEVEIDNLSRAALYPDHPAGLSIDGTPDSIRRFTRRHLVAHLQRFYVPANMVVTVAGPLDPADVFAAARRAFSLLRTGPRPPLPEGSPRSVRGPAVKVVPHPGAQTQLRFSWNALPAQDPRMAALTLLRRILDDGFTSRFQAELVDRRGLAYEMWADVDALEDHGTVEFGATVSPGKEVATARALLAEARRVATTAPGRQEVERARQRQLWAFLQMHDNAAAVAEWYGRQTLLGLPASPDAVLQSAQKVRPSDVRAVAAAILDPDALVLTAVGVLSRREAAQLRVLVRSGARAR